MLVLFKVPGEVYDALRVDGVTVGHLRGQGNVSEGVDASCYAHARCTCTHHDGSADAETRLPRHGGLRRHAKAATRSSERAAMRKRRGHDMGSPPSMASMRALRVKKPPAWRSSSSSASAVPALGTPPSRQRLGVEGGASGGVTAALRTEEAARARPASCGA